MSDDGWAQMSSNSPEEDQQLPDRPYHSKRPHKKSRKGCVNCKTRKVKCDEVRPTCKSCRLRKVDCVYSSAAPTATASTISTPKAPIVVPQTTSFHTQSTYSSSTSSGESPDDGLTLSFTTPELDLNDSLDFDFNLQPETDVLLPSALTPDPWETQLPPLTICPIFRPSPSFDNVDLKLLWFYTANTCTSFAVNDGHHKVRVEDTFRSTIVRYAFQSPFLMNSLFALSSLHMQMDDKTLDPRRLTRYRARAFEGYRQAIEAADPDTFPALLANSIILCGLSSQTFRDPDSKPLYLVDWMVVWKGIGLMIDFIGLDRLFTSGLSSIFFRPAIDLARSARCIPSSLLFMISSIPSDDRDQESITIYYNSLKYLGSLFLALKAGFGPILNLRVITWFTFIPTPFLALCQEHRPRALVILGYYAAFLRLVDDVWWLKGIGDRSVRDIVSHLGPAWADTLRLPVATLDTTDHILIARIILEDPTWTSTEQPVNQTEAMDVDNRKLTWVNQQGTALDSNGKLNNAQMAMKRAGAMDDNEIYAPFSPQFKSEFEGCCVHDFELKHAHCSAHAAAEEVEKLGTEEIMFDHQRLVCAEEELIRGPSKDA